MIKIDDSKYIYCHLLYFFTSMYFYLKKELKNDKINRMHLKKMISNSKYKGGIR